MTNWINLTETDDQPVWLNPDHIAAVAASTDGVTGAEATVSLAGGAVFDVVETPAEVMYRISEATARVIDIVPAPIRIGSDVERAAAPEGVGAGSSGQPTLLIYGASDDLVEVEGYLTEEYQLGEESEVTLLITAPDGQYLNVRARFGVLGWELSALHRRGGQWPWPIRAVSHPGQPEDPALLLEVPEGATVTHLDRI